MYSILILLHSWVRWAFLLMAIIAIYRAITGLMKKSPYTVADNKTSTIFLSIAHTQLLIGIILWFISENIQQALSGGMASIMADSTKRLMVVEHPITMILGIALIQIGKIKVRKAYADQSRHMRSLIYYGFGLILVLSRIPWHAPLFKGLQ